MQCFVIISPGVHARASVIARSGATKRSAAPHGLDCFAPLAMMEIGIGSYRRDLTLGRALAGPCPLWQSRIPVVGVSIQPASCIFRRYYTCYTHAQGIWLTQ